MSVCATRAWRGAGGSVMRGARGAVGAKLRHFSLPPPFRPGGRNNAQLRRRTFRHHILRGELAPLSPRRSRLTTSRARSHRPRVAPLARAPHCLSTAMAPPASAMYSGSVSAMCAGANAPRIAPLNVAISLATSSSSSMCISHSRIHALSPALNVP